MHIHRKFIALTLFFALTAHSVYGQPAYSQDYEYEDYSDSAYMQSSHTAHWSAYVPIAALIAAGIFWGVADKRHTSSSSHASSISHNGLGPLDSYNYSSYSTGYTTSGYSH